MNEQINMEQLQRSIADCDIAILAYKSMIHSLVKELIALRTWQERLGDPDHWFENLNDHLRGCAWAEADEEYDELADQCRALLKRAKGET